MMAKNLLSLWFGWLPVAAMDIHTASPVQTDSYCARGYPICYYTLECLHGYSLECKSLGCDAEEKVCEDFGGNFKASDWNGMCGTWEEVENRYECCHCIGSMTMPQTVAPSTSFHRCYDSGDQCPDSFSGSCCFTRLTCPSGYTLSEPLGICDQTECGIENYEASELNYMASDCNGAFPGDRVLCQTCVKDEGETTTTTTLAPLTLVMTTVTTTGEVVAGRSERAFEWSTLTLTALTALRSCIQEVPGRSEDELQALRAAFVLEWPALVPWLVDPHRFQMEVQSRVLMDDRWWRNGSAKGKASPWTDTEWKVQAAVTSRRLGPEADTKQSACLGVWQLTDDHPCHHMSRGEAISADGMPRTRVLGVGLMKAGTTVIWQALGAALNLSMGMDCEALSQGEVLD